MRMSISPYSAPGIKYEPNKEGIVEAVSAVTSVSRDEMKSNSRLRRICTARHLAMYFLRKLTTLSLKEIGNVFGRDHATVLHAERKITDIISYDRMLREQVRRLDEMLTLDEVDTQLTINSYDKNVKC